MNEEILQQKLSRVSRDSNSDQKETKISPEEHSKNDISQLECLFKNTKEAIQKCWENMFKTKQVAPILE